MSSSTLFRVGAVLGVIAAVLLAVEAPFPDTALTETLAILAIACVIFGLTALYLFQRKEAGLLGDVGYFVNVFGNVLTAGAIFFLAYVVTVADEEVTLAIVDGPAGLYLLVTFVILGLGGLLFGISVIRARVFHPVAGALYGIGFFVIAGFLLLQLPKLVGVIASEVAALGIVWLSVQLWQAVPQAGTMAAAAD